MSTQTMYIKNNKIIFTKNIVKDGGAIFDIWCTVGYPKLSFLVHSAVLYNSACYDDIGGFGVGGNCGVQEGVEVCEVIFFAIDYQDI